MSIPDTTVTFTYADGQAIVTPADLSHVWVEHFPDGFSHHTAPYSRIEVVYSDARSGEPSEYAGGVRVGAVKSFVFDGDDHEARSAEVFAAIAVAKQTAGAIAVAADHLTS